MLLLIAAKISTGTYDCSNTLNPSRYVKGSGHRNLGERILKGCPLIMGFMVRLQKLGA